MVSNSSVREASLQQAWFFFQLMVGSYLHFIHSNHINEYIHKTMHKPWSKFLLLWSTQKTNSSSTAFCKALSYLELTSLILLYVITGEEHGPSSVPVLTNGHAPTPALSRPLCGWHRRPCGCDQRRHSQQISQSKSRRVSFYRWRNIDPHETHCR